MRQSLGLRTSQQLSLTPQLQQSIRLLQLSTLDLNQEVQHMLEQNPFLESDSGDEKETSLEELQRDWQENEQANRELQDSFFELSDEASSLPKHELIDWQQTQQESHWDLPDQEIASELTPDAQIDTTVASDPNQDSFLDIYAANSANLQESSWLESIEAPAALGDYLAQQIRLLALPLDQELAMFFWLIRSMTMAI